MLLSVVNAQDGSNAPMVKGVYGTSYYTNVVMLLQKSEYMIEKNNRADIMTE